MNQAVIDADFFTKLTTNELSPRLFIRIMQDLQLSPVMHQYVYEQELKHHPYVKDLKESRQLKVYDYRDFLATPKEHEEYKKYFLDSYEYLVSEEFPTNADIYTYHAPKEHLGEIRSIYLALKMQFPYFASDDKGARQFLRNYVSSSMHTITAISVIEAIRLCKAQGSNLQWKDLKGCIPVAYRDDEAAINLIKELVTPSAKYAHPK